MSLPSMHGRVVAISGATSGIGEAAAVRLASLGARVILIARNRERADRTLAALDAVSPSEANHSAYLADLSLVRDTARVALDMALAESRIDVLVNNAGGLFFSGESTAEGLERTFALNHMSYFVLTHGLHHRIPRGGRIVNTSSEAHRAAPAGLDDLPEFSDRGFRAYARTKAFNILFTRAAAARLEHAGVSVNCLHPGLVRTRLFGERGIRSRFLGLIALVGGVPVEKGADTLVYLAASEDGNTGTGGYFSERQRLMTTAFAEDRSAADRLWTISEDLLGRYGP